MQIGSDFAAVESLWSEFEHVLGSQQAAEDQQNSGGDAGEQNNHGR